MFQPVMTKIIELATQAWGFLVGLIIVVALLGGLYYVLQGTAGTAIGAGGATKTAILGAIGLVILVLIVFLVLPQLGTLLYQNTPPPPFQAP
jgi:hypothetical protein